MFKRLNWRAVDKLGAGCYFGGNAGAGWGSAEFETSVDTISGSSDSARFVGGGQIGCDWQTGAWVFGIRNMFDWADADRSGTIGSGAFTGYSAKLENDWLDLLKGRIGFAVQQHHTYIFLLLSAPALPSVPPSRSKLHLMHRRQYDGQRDCTVCFDYRFVGGGGYCHQRSRLDCCVLNGGHIQKLPRKIP